MTPEKSVPLPEALEALRAGGALGVQSRYGYDGSNWWDTLMNPPRGVRRIRIEHRLE